MKALGVPRPSYLSLARPRRYFLPGFLVLMAVLLAAPWFFIFERADVTGKRGSVVSTRVDFVRPEHLEAIDLLIVVDQTSSYADDLGQLQESFPLFLEELAVLSDLRVAAVGFTDVEHVDWGYEIHSPWVRNAGDVGRTVVALPTSGTGLTDDPAEMSLAALQKSLDGFSFRPDSTPIVFLLTDARGRELGDIKAPTVAGNFAERQAMIFPVVPDEFDGDSTEAEEQLTLLTKVTDGSLISADGRSGDIISTLSDHVQYKQTTLSPELLWGCPVVENSVSVEPSELTGSEDGSRGEVEIRFQVSEDATRTRWTCTIDFGVAGTETFTLEVK